MDDDDAENNYLTTARTIHQVRDKIVMKSNVGNKVVQQEDKCRPPETRRKQSTFNLPDESFCKPTIGVAFYYSHFGYIDIEFLNVKLHPSNHQHMLPNLVVSSA